MHEIQNLIINYVSGVFPYFWLLKMQNVALDSFCYHLLSIIGTRKRNRGISFGNRVIKFMSFNV